MNLEIGQKVEITLEVDKGGSWSDGPTWVASDGGSYLTKVIAGDKLSGEFTADAVGYSQITVTGTNNGVAVSAKYDINVISATDPAITLTGAII
jgi:hypothetical protein